MQHYNCSLSKSLDFFRYKKLENCYEQTFESTLTGSAIVEALSAWFVLSLIAKELDKLFIVYCMMYSYNDGYAFVYNGPTSVYQVILAKAEGEVSSTFLYIIEKQILCTH